jgi:hypothetical protein
MWQRIGGGLAGLHVGQRGIDVDFVPDRNHGRGNRRGALPAGPAMQVSAHSLIEPGVDFLGSSFEIRSRQPAIVGQAHPIFFDSRLIEGGLDRRTLSWTVLFVLDQVQDAPDARALQGPHIGLVQRIGADQEIIENVAKAIRAKPTGHALMIAAVRERDPRDHKRAARQREPRDREPDPRRPVRRGRPGANLDADGPPY